MQKFHKETHRTTSAIFKNPIKFNQDLIDLNVILTFPRLLKGGINNM